MKLRWLVFGFVVFVGGEVAQATEYLKSPIPSKIRLAPTTYDQTLLDIIGEKGKKPRWHVVQWGIVPPFPNITDCLGSCSDRTWQVQNTSESGRVLFTSTPSEGNIVEFTQDTTGSKFSGCDPAQEFDLFIEPNSAGTHPGYPVGLIESRRPVLGAVSNLHIQIRQQIVSVQQGTRCNPPYNVGATLMALVFGNDVTGEALFYQVITYDSRGATSNGAWYFTSSPYGVNDDVTLYGQPFLTPGTSSILYDIDVAARLRTLIQTSPHLPGEPTGPSKNPANWKLSDAYFGSLVNGEARIVSRHSQIRLFSDN